MFLVIMNRDRCARLGGGGNGTKSFRKIPQVNFHLDKKYDNTAFFVTEMFAERSLGIPVALVGPQEPHSSHLRNRTFLRSEDLK